MDADWTHVGGSLECVSCVEPFSFEPERAPLVLLCGHSICDACVQGSPRRKASFKCPLCAEVIAGRPSPNRSFQALLPRLQALNKARTLAAAVQPMCENCDDVPANVFCGDCSCELCSRCTQIIHTPKALRNHTLCAASERTQDLCGKHQQKTTLVCMKCLRMVCHLCTAEDHAGHPCELQEIAFKQVRSTLIKCLEETEALDNRAKVAAANYENVLPARTHFSCGSPVSNVPRQACLPNHQNNNAASLSKRDQIVQHFDRVHAALTQRKSILLSQYDEVMGSRAALLSDQQAEIAALRITVSQARFQVQAVLDGDGRGLLAQFHQCLSILEEINNTPLPDFTQQPEAEVTLPQTLLEDVLQHGAVGDACEDRVTRLTERAEKAEKELRAAHKSLELARAREAAVPLYSQPGKGNAKIKVVRARHVDVDALKKARLQVGL
eukprot:TRINITY_DN20621_c0_g1_i1.p1 TRINITY_DN20621_c0_g1~~TRINITY_DN20621_c0_g1_i1.p1  ORF type:complete len:440 (-),score=61.44 TRINITY_DN20621_c0_g1_i1:221-1540(-)